MPENNGAQQTMGFGQFHVGPTVETGLVRLATKGPKAVQYTMVDGRPLFEGDIELALIGPGDVENAAVAEEQAGVIIPGTQFRWPNGTVPYDIDPALPNQGRVTDAIAHWERNTRIRFVRRTAANQAQFPDFVMFRPGTGCSSAVGRTTGQQNITLEGGCDTGSTIHEIGHATGLWHEQSREDRDQFVRINWQNILQAQAHNFNQHITDGDDVGPYDYHSIMHYPRWAFSSNGQDTIVPLQNVEIGQRQGLSPGDCRAVRTMYSNLEPAARFSGTQFSAKIEAFATSRWFTHSWPAQWYVIWTVAPTAPIVDGPAQVSWNVQVTRQSGGLLKYFLAITNLTSGQIEIEARYDVLGWSLSAT
ncbi:Dot/Icm T4SS effector Zinc-dependent metalloprotease LegP [Nonomuraea composti]|uniref:Dot/Icm T4SS effector Zinc-dependent metalloprotease LegP n=1 Tax=Nonomuraea composti TaxID=2720023 RepID=UPI00197DFE26|nr:Dot/Icm T4SS effector Zinc-dependent metalloprotease LegP [Nonomuraea sp. FMUSA5-5]